MKVKRNFIVIPTVQGTGSRLVANHIFAEFANADWHKPPMGKRCTYYDHLYPQRIERFQELCAKYPAVVPMRHPLRVARTWEEHNWVFEYYFQQWEALIELIDPLGPMYICVDLKRREDDLRAISEAIGHNLSTIWPYISDRDGDPRLEPLESITDLRNQADVESFISKHSDFFGRFYA